MEKEEKFLHKRISELETEVEELTRRCLVNDRFASVMNILDAGVVIHRHDTSISYCNPAALRILGLTMDQILGKTTLDPRWFFSDASGNILPVDEYPVNRVIKSGAPLSGQFLGVFIPEEEAVRWLLVNGMLLDFDQEGAEIIITFVDITDTKNALEALKHSEVSIANIIDRAPLGVCVTDEKGFFESVNQAYCRFYGYSEAEILGRHFTMVVPEPQKKALADLHDEFIASGAEIRGEWDVIDSQGAAKAVLADAALITDRHGKRKKVTFIMDITREKKFQRQLEEKNKELERMNRTDSLTGVANRRHVFDILENEIRRRERHEGPLSIAMIDIDFFKRINDNLGHQAGDEVLRQTARVIASAVRDVDVVGRYGGEEFIVIMPNTNKADAGLVAERIRSVLADTPMSDEKISVTVSCGVSEYQDQGVLPFVDSADQNLYQAKNAGRNRVVAT